MNRASFVLAPGRGPALPFLAALGFAAAALSVSRPARADVSSWASASMGATFFDEGDQLGKDFVSAPALTLRAGIGLPPSLPVVVGGLFHLQTNFGYGTDLGLLARFASRGFVLGGWGAAVDLGGYERFWGQDSAGGLGSVVLGAPWGLELSANGSLGSHGAHQFGFALGIDFVRLTVYRTAGTDWFPNPYPAYPPQK